MKEPEIPLIPHPFEGTDKYCERWETGHHRNEAGRSVRTETQCGYPRHRHVPPITSE